MTLDTAIRAPEPVARGADDATLQVAARRLAGWGFLADPDLPDRPGPASLIVALRRTPTFEHYDPEFVEFWASTSARGSRRDITRRSKMPLRTEFSWGEIRITDRLGVSNEYLAFGGRCVADVIDDTVIVSFESSAPLLRRGGHSQGWDEGADAVGAFFGRLLVTVDYVPGFEAMLAEATPLARYAAFLRDATSRYRRAHLLTGMETPFAALARVEAERVRRSDPNAWDDGGRLLEHLGRT